MMKITISARGVRGARGWTAVDAAEDLTTAMNIARAWYAKGYRVRVDVDVDRERYSLA